MRLILVWLINAAAIFLLPYILAAVHIKDFSTRSRLMFSRMVWPPRSMRRFSIWSMGRVIVCG